MTEGIPQTNLLKRQKRSLASKEHQFVFVFNSGFEKEVRKQLEEILRTPRQKLSSGAKVEEHPLGVTIRGLSFAWSYEFLKRATFVSEVYWICVEKASARSYSQVAKWFESKTFSTFLGLAENQALSTKLVVKVSDPSSAFYHKNKTRNLIAEHLEQLNFHLLPHEDKGTAAEQKFLFLFSAKNLDILVSLTGTPGYMRGYPKTEKSVAPLREDICHYLLSHCITSAHKKILLVPFFGSGSLAWAYLESLGYAEFSSADIWMKRQPFYSQPSFDYVASKSLNPSGELEAVYGCDILPCSIPKRLQGNEINVKQEDFHAWACNVPEILREVRPEEVVVLLNPPYGKRLGEKDEIGRLYKAITSFLNSIVSEKWKVSGFALGLDSYVNAAFAADLDSKAYKSFTKKVFIGGLPVQSFYFRSR